MLWSMGLIMMVGWLGGNLFAKIKLPRLLAYLLAGILMGPYGLNLIEDSLVNMAGDIRQFALMIILIRAGLSMNFSDLAKVGRPAILMGFLPALCELLGVGLIAPLVLGMTYAESFLLGSVLAAVSPAVLVPRMVAMMDQGLGTRKAIPQMLLAAGTADDILIFVLFAVFMQMNQGHGFSLASIWMVPVTLVTGIGLGYLAGKMLLFVQKYYQFSQLNFMVISLAVSMLLMGLEKMVSGFMPYSGVLAVMVAYLIVQKQFPNLSQKLSRTYQKVWSMAEIFLFAFLGVAVNASLALQAGGPLLLVIVFGLLCRMVGVCLSVLKTPFSWSERFFIMGAYIPKATVQASLGGLPLMAGLESGLSILIAATLSILLTAPFGAFFIDYFGPRLLEKEEEAVT